VTYGEAIKEETVGYVFHVAVPAPKPALALDGLELDYSGFDDELDFDGDEVLDPAGEPASVVEDAAGIGTPSAEEDEAHQRRA
jgi:hypothetical protein